MREGREGISMSNIEGQGTDKKTKKGKEGKDRVSFSDSRGEVFEVRRGHMVDDLAEKRETEK